MRSLRILWLGFFCLVLLLWLEYIKVAYADGGGATPRCSCPPATIRVWRISGNGPQPGQPGYIVYHDMENDYLGGVLIAEVGPDAARTFATYRCQYRTLLWHNGLT